MRRLLRNAVIVLVLSTVVIIGIQWNNYNNAVTAATEQASITLDETVVETGDLTVTVSGTGAITPERQTALTFELSAPVVEILAPEGTQVNAGDPIARVDAADFDANVGDAQLALEIEQLSFNALTAPPREVDLAAAEAALTAAIAGYNAAVATGPDSQQVEIARLQTELARNQLWQTQLQADGAVNLDLFQFPPDTPPEVEQFIRDTINGFNAQNRIQFSTALEQSEFGIDIADANFAAVQLRGPDLGAVNSANAAIVQAQIARDRLVNGPNEFELAQAQIELENAEIALEQAQNAADRTLLTAPFSGVIAQNNLIVGQLPPTDSISVLLIDTSGYYIDVPIDETDVVNVQVGQSVTLVLDALPEANISGQVTQIAVTPTRVGQLVTYLVRVALDPTSEAIRIGMTATARIATQEVKDTLLIRNSFIRIDRTTQQAFVTIALEDGTYQEIPIVLGARNDTFSQVVSGVTEGQRIVLLPRNAVIPGQ
ncbi:MAG: efflux RND transporter periplasmic adaptor subunit [Anaerolineae bacterium]|jgi:HlyD family secretion protein|nr:efflux RND transporter periplasmic adaptor subunit [Anaerolineae bacterium]